MKPTIPMQIERFFNIHRRNQYKLEPYLLKDGRKHPVAIICPGGGYQRVSGYNEGRPFARVLNELGFHAFVVFYRVQDKARFPHPQDDLARAVREIHSRAAQWNLDMEGYSLWGSSAGGHLAASFATEGMGWAKYGLPRPGALVLAYPVITLGEHTHAGTRNNLLGPSPSPAQIDAVSIHKHVTAAFPPTYVWWGDADTSVPPVNSRLLLAALEEQGIPHGWREYPGVPHGVGLGKGLACEGWMEDAVDFWKQNLPGFDR